ncbi:MAG: VWA domain-containing protein, partial [bacterium]
MIRFAHIEFFYLLLLVPLFLLLYGMYNRWRKKAGRRFGDQQVISSLMPRVSDGKPLVKFLLLLIAFILLVIGLVDPQIGTKLEKVKRQGIDMMLVLDVSNSMLAEDIKPNRLERSKMAISNLIDRLEGDRIGIIIFAGNAYKQLPLTTDYSAAKLFLSAVDTRIVPTQGTAIGEAITMATESFDEEEHNKAIVVITDGENHEDDAISAAAAASEKGIK